MAEIAALEAVLGDRAVGGVPVVVVHGEAGIGKTSLVARFAGDVAGRGSTVLWGACYEDSGPPYGPWVEAIDHHVASLSRERVVELLGSDAAVLASVAPGIRAVLGDVPSAPVLSPAEGQLRLFDAVARFFERLGEPVLVLDDMQWADASALDLLVHVARLVAGLVIVVIFRGARLDLEHPLAIRLARVGRERSCTYLLLEGLSLEEAGELLERAASKKLEPRLVEAIYGDTGGNPFFLGELGRHIQRVGGWAAREPGEWQLPESIRGAVALRLAGLSTQTWHMLQLASVFTAGFEFAELQALTEFEEGSLLDCLEQALVEELVRPLDGERYDFAHALVRQTLYERLSPSRRARLHRRLAEALERLHGDDPARVAGELVRQYHASATLAGAHRGATHALSAAREAREAGAPADAVVFLRLGLDLVAGEDMATRARVLGELALAEAEAGLFEDAPRTLEAAISVLERSGKPGEAIAELVYSVGKAFASTPPSLQAIEPLIARGLAAVGQTRRLAWARLRLLYRSAPPETFGPVRVLRPAGFDPDAVRIARSQGTEADYAVTVDNLAPSFGAEVEELISRIDGWTDPVARLRALLPVVWYLTLLKPGSSPDTDRLCAELGVLADDVGFVPHRASVPVFRAALLGGRGEFDAAADQIGQARALFERQSPAGSNSALVTLVGELTAQHVAADWPRLAEVMWDLARSPEDAGWLSLRCAAFAAQAFVSAGDADRAREVLGYILPALESVQPFEYATTGAGGLAGGAVWELRAADLAERLLPRALALGDADGVEFYMTSATLTVARLSAVVGRFDQAVEYFERARVTLERRDQRPMRAIVDFDEALARLEHRQPGAAELLLAAETRFEELGMSVWLERIAGLRRSREGLPDGLTRREAEVLRLLASGQTNRQIAETLVLSVHTVERHLDNAYAKIGAHNRADASAYTVRHGL